MAKSVYENTVIVSVTENQEEQAIIIKRAAKEASLSDLTATKVTQPISYTELSSISIIEGHNANFSLNGGRKGQSFAFQRLDKLSAAK